MWSWAVHQLLDRVQHYACTRCHGRYRPELLKLLRDNLDPLSKLAGFNPALASDTWHALPTHTLRLAEVLLKIYLSNFGVGEIIFLFTADPHVDGDDPFPLQEHNEALDSPLELPGRRSRAHAVEAAAHPARGAGVRRGGVAVDVDARRARAALAVRLQRSRRDRARRALLPARCRRRRSSRSRSITGATPSRCPRRAPRR